MSVIVILFEYLLKPSFNYKKFLRFRSTNHLNVDQIYEIIYKKIQCFLLNKLLTYPSISDDIIKYYQQVFETLILLYRMYDLNLILNYLLSIKKNVFF